MSGARRARAVHDDGLRADFAGEGARAYSPDDRTYMILMYQEHATLARQQDVLRTVWILAMLVIATPLGFYGLTGERPWVVGAMLCGLGLVSMAVLTKHESRYRLHSRIMRSFRKELSETVRPDISGLTSAGRIQHDRSHRVASWINLQACFLMIALAVMLCGAAMMWRAGVPDLPQHATQQPTSGPLLAPDDAHVSHTGEHR